MNQCIICKNVIKDKERDIVQTCILAATQNNPSLIILGTKGCCPYFQELLVNYGWGAK